MNLNRGCVGELQLRTGPVCLSRKRHYHELPVSAKNISPLLKWSAPNIIIIAGNFYSERKRERERESVHRCRPGCQECFVLR